jgi:NTP pyrophosphatase (non-canonical NTP hydrolase)
MPTKTFIAAIDAASAIPDQKLREDVAISVMNNRDWYGAVKAFHALYECPDDTAIGTTRDMSHMTQERLDLRLGLIEEEFDRELRPAVAARDIIETADALGDIIYVVIGFALELGIDLNSVIGEIQASNMTKLGEDGQVIRREDGKILKGPNYVKPDIAAILKYRD